MEYDSDTWNKIAEANTVSEMYKIAGSAVTVLNLVDKGAMDIERRTLNLQSQIQDLTHYAISEDRDTQKDVYKASTENVDMMLDKLDAMKNLLQMVRQTLDVIDNHGAGARIENS